LVEWRQRKFPVATSLADGFSSTEPLAAPEREAGLNLNSVRNNAGKAEGDLCF
jgi:hypothetical protein